MTSILSRLPRLLHHIRSHHISCIGFGLRSKELTARGFSKSSGSDWTILPDENEYQFIGNDRRFSLPGNLGQSRDVKLNYKTMKMCDLVDYRNVNVDRLHIRINTCPFLLKTDAVAMFDLMFGPNGPKSIISLSYNHFRDEELGQKYLYTAACWIADILTEDGYPANFMNPYTGKPQFDYPAKRRESLPKMKFTQKMRNKCVYITERKTNKIGTIYSSAPPSYILHAIQAYDTI